jgi:hypothetical protein
MNGIIIYLNILKWPYYRKRKRRIHRKSCKQQIDILRKIVQEVHPVRWSIIIIIKSKSISSLLIYLYLSLFLFTEKEGNGSSSSDNFFFHVIRDGLALQHKKNFKQKKKKKKSFVLHSPLDISSCVDLQGKERKKEEKSSSFFYMYV